MTTRKSLKIGLLVIFFLLPGVRTFLAVYLQWWPAVLYPLFQLVMIAIPIVVWVRSGLSGRQVCELAGAKRTSTVRGLLVGAMMGVVILAGYFLIQNVLPRPMIDPKPLLAKIQSLKLLEWYWLMTIVMSLWNSLFEEYYWRAFLTAELGKRTKSTLAICVIGGGMFGLHHLFVLLDLFDPPLVILFTFGTMAAGAAWTWMRRRGHSIWDCYISHIIADITIFWIGYDLITT